MPSEHETAILTRPQPEGEPTRLILFAIRRMAIGGLHDAHAAQAVMGGFGVGFRRPLVLLRALMLELSRVAARKLTVAPCCCPQVTRDEAALLDAIAAADDMPRAAHTAFARLLGVRHAPAAFSAGQALAVACADLGRPLDAG